MTAKIIKQQASLPKTSNLIHAKISSQRNLLFSNSQTSLSESACKFKLDAKMCKSVKPKIYQTEATSQENIQKDERGKKDRTCDQKFGKASFLNNCSLSKSKKLTDSYYYQNSKKNRESDFIVNASKNKGKQSTKAHSHHRLVNFKQSKPKIFVNRKTQKTSTQNKVNTINNNISSHGNYNSLKRLISSIQLSQNFTKLRTLRSFSPQVQFISEQLSHRKKDKRMLKKQQQTLERMRNLLDDYQRTLIKEQKQKEVLLKQNRKLRQKLILINSEKKYKTVADYNV